MTFNVTPEIRELEAILRDLAAIPSPPGFEEPLIKEMMKRLERYVDRIEVDPRGNVIGVIEGSEPRDVPSVLMAAHLDEVGFIVFHIDGGGFLRFRKLGGATERALQGQRVVVHGNRGEVPGVIGTKPGHIITPEEALKIPPLEEMYIDVGASSREEAEEMGIEVGSPVTFQPGIASLGMPYRLAGKAVDDRAGLAVLLMVAKQLKNTRPKGEVYVAATVEEEVGLRGAAILAENLKPDMAIVVDTVPSNGTPDLTPGALPYEIGKGPIIKVSEELGLITHRKVREMLIQASREAGARYQLGAATPGRSDATAMQQTGKGLPTTMLGIPRRYSHSPVETLDLRDLHDAVKILVAFTHMLDEKTSLARI